MERENFYILLELPYDPPENDKDRIKAAIHRKKQEWTRLQENPVRRAEALQYMGMAGEMEELMLDPQRRAEEAERAAALRGEMRRRFGAELKVLEGKGYLLPREAARIAVKYKPYGITREMVDKAAQVPITETPPQKEAPQEEGGQVVDRITAKTIQRNLALLGYTDLYDFLGEVPYASVKKLTEAAEKKRRTAAASGAKTSQSVLVQELSGIALKLFQDFDSKQLYDRFLKVSQYPALGQLIDEENNRSKHIGTTALLRLINFGVETFGLKVLDAEDYIRRYCAAYQIPVNAKGVEIVCPHCHNKTDRQAAVCTVCSAPLRGDCPGCGTAFEAGEAVCRDCGFALSKMGDALRYLDEAETALIENSWSTADRAIQYARRYWPGHPRIELLEQQAAKLEKRYSRYMDAIADCLVQNRYYGALELVQEAASHRIRLPDTTVSQIRSTITKVEQQIQALQKQSDGLSYNALHKLASTVSDSLELNRILAEFPPEPPARLSAEIRGRRVYMQWGTSPSPGAISYVVVRKTGSRPLTAYDGDVLYDGPANSFTDKKADALLEHYYGVFAKRGAACSSKGAVTGPAMIVPEIENLHILPADRSATLAWDFNPDIREVRIWRKRGGERPVAQEDGIRLENDRLDGYVDGSLKNEVEYWYYLIAVYVVDGKRIYSHGVCDSVIPHEIIAPIEDLTIAKVERGSDEYVVSWQGAQYSDVLLLASTKKPSCRSGDMLPLATLMERYRKLDLEAKQADSARFRYSFSGGLYVFAAAVYGKFATVGRPYYLTNVQDPLNVTHDLLNGDLYLNLKFPAGISQVVLAWRFDRYPTSPHEPGATTQFCTKEQYDYNAALVMKEPEKTAYYCKLYSFYVAPDGSRAYSDGVEVFVDNRLQQELLYGISFRKPLFSKTSKLVLTISSDREFTMPKMLLAGKIGRLPLKKTDGMPLVEISRETKVDGSISFEYQTSALPKNLYARLFLRDDDLYGKFRLLPEASAKLT